MNPSSFDSAAVRRTGPAWAIASATAGLLSITGCGGGSDDSASPLAHSEASAATRAAASVQLEGCVVDEFFIPRTGTTVRLLGADGRLLGHASSNEDGVFTLQVPAQQVVSVNVDKAGG